MKDKLEQLLSIFNQKWIFDSNKKWLLQYPETNIENIVDQDLKALVKRLSFATQSEDVQKDIETEENFDDSLDDALRAKDIVIWQKEKELESKERELEQIQKEKEERDAYIRTLEEKLKNMK